jgi:predicted MFS family arabinose efflux permease
MGTMSRPEMEQLSREPATGIEEADTPSPAYLGWVLGLLAMVSFFNYLDRMVMSILVEPIKAELGFSDAQLGLLTGFAFALFYATFGIPIARLADSKPRVLILSVCMTLWSLMTAACGLAHAFVHMLLARIGVGVGEAGCVPTSHSLLSDYFPPHRRAFALGVFQAGGSLGIMTGLMSAGVLADTLGWRWAFPAVGLPGVLFALVAWLTIREPARGRLEGKSREQVAAMPTGRALRTLLGRPTYRQILIGYALGLFPVYGIGQWVPAFLVRVHGMSLSSVGLWFGLASGLGGFLGIVLGAVGSPLVIRRDRRWELWWPAAAYTLCIPLYGYAFLGGSLAAVIVALFAAALVAGSGIGPGMASVQTVSEPQLRATAIAMIMLFSALLGQGGGPLLIGIVSDFLEPSVGIMSLRWALVASLGIFIWCVVHFLLGARTMPRDAVN